MEGNDFNCRIYQKLPQIVLGFHGCDQTTVDLVLQSNDKHLKPSENTYDWLGEGIYFWLNDPQRAFEWAGQYKARNKIKKPAVIGAIIDLGMCLNLCERESILLLQRSYEDLSVQLEENGMDINEELKNSMPDANGYTLRRNLDCAVINNLHRMMLEAGQSFDTVYGYFQEGEDAFPGAGIKEKNHIQISVRNTDCIKGYFLPRK